MCRRPDVGLGNVRIPDSCRRYHCADTLTLERAIARTNRSHSGQSSGPVAEWCGGTLKVATEPILIISVSSVSPAAVVSNQGTPTVSRPAAISDYWALTKPEVNFLIAIATLTGFYLAFPGHLARFPWMLLVHTLLGTLLV